MEKTFFSNLKTKVIKKFLSHFEGYIFITEQMNLCLQLDIYNQTPFFLMYEYHSWHSWAQLPLIR